MFNSDCKLYAAPSEILPKQQSLLAVQNCTLPSKRMYCGNIVVHVLMFITFPCHVYIVTKDTHTKSNCILHN